MPEEVTRTEQDRLQREQDKQGRDQDKLDARLVNLDTKLGSIDNRLVSVEERLKSIDLRLSNHSSAFDKIDSKLDHFAAMQMTILSHTEEISVIKKWIAAVWGKVLAVAIGITTLLNLLWKMIAGK